jgi:hypothetical protein
MICQRGQKTRYPVAYTLWNKGASSSRVDIHKSLEQVIAEVECINLWAQPVNKANLGSPWLTARRAALKALDKVIAESFYQAHSGVCTWFNAIYWIKILQTRPDGLLIIENLSDVGKAKARYALAAIEPDLIYPLLRGRDIRKWHASPSAHLVLVQDPDLRSGVDETWLKINLPATYAFLYQFRAELVARSGYKKFFQDAGAPFYTMYNVGPYTMAPYKVGWAREDTLLRCSVFSQSLFEQDAKLVMPDQTVQFISLKTETEAHFICALLNSAPATAIPLAYTTDITTHILSVISVPQFDRKNPLHTRLAKLSKQAHQLAAGDKHAELSAIEAQIDQAAAELWSITDKELQEIRRSLEELG